MPVIMDNLQGLMRFLHRVKKR